MAKRLAFALCLACGHPSTPRAVPPPPAPSDAAPRPTTIGVTLDVTPRDAEVVIDGESRGKAAELPQAIELPPGVHALEITRDGYASFRVEVTVSDKLESFHVRLDPR